MNEEEEGTRWQIQRKVRVVTPIERNVDEKAETNPKFTDRDRE